MSIKISNSKDCNQIFVFCLVEKPINLERINLVRISRTWTFWQSLNMDVKSLTFFDGLQSFQLPEEVLFSEIGVLTSRAWFRACLTRLGKSSSYARQITNFLFLLFLRVMFQEIICNIKVNLRLRGQLIKFVKVFLKTTRRPTQGSTLF